MPNSFPAITELGTRVNGVLRLGGISGPDDIRRLHLDPRDEFNHYLALYPRRLQQAESADALFRHLQSNTFTEISFFYLHFPFCARVCDFCPYHVSRDFKPMRSYIAALQDEISTFAPVLQSSGCITHLYLGGGTPSVVPVEMISGTLERVLAYQRNIGCVTMEMHPQTLAPHLEQLIIDNYVTRVSLGVQTFNKSILDKTQRIWVSLESVIAVCDRFRRAGCRSINLDFMVGLKNQRLDDVYSDAQAIHQLVRSGLVDSISVAPRRFSDNSKLVPDEAITPTTTLERLRQDAAYRILLREYMDLREPRPYHYTNEADAGPYVQMSSSARSDSGVLNTLGLGNASFSYCVRRNFRNVRGVEEYVNAIRRFGLATGEEHRIDSDEYLIRYLLFGLRRGYLTLRPPFSTAPSTQERISHLFQQFETKALGTVEGGVFHVSDVGKLLLDWMYNACELGFRQAAVVS